MIDKKALASPPLDPTLRFDRRGGINSGFNILHDDYEGVSSHRLEKWGEIS